MATTRAGIGWGVPGPVCVQCGGRLIGWGGYWRHLRHQLTVLRVRVRRRRCRSCGRTQSLLSAPALERRLDTVETIGKAVVRRLSGATIRATAEALGCPRRPCATGCRGITSERHRRAGASPGQPGPEKLDVRIGAVHALEQIARDSAELHWPIMEALTAYLREHAPVRAPAAAAADDGPQDSGGVRRGRS